MAQLLSNLPIGAKVKFGRYSVEGEPAQDIIWLVVAKNHNSVPTYPSNSVTLFTEKVIDVRVFDAPEFNNSNSNRQSYGNNQYKVSNIDQWLNKDAPAGEWYVSQHSTDAPHHKDVARPGFLNAFTTLEKNAILLTTIRSMDSNSTTFEYEDIQRKVYLASATELGGSDDDGIEGSTWEYFTTNSVRTTITAQVYEHSLRDHKNLSPTMAATWFTRTPIRTDGAYVRGVVDVVSRYTLPCNSESSGVRPALNLLSTMRVSETTDNEGCYNIIFNVAPLAPTAFNLPSRILGGKTNAISWSASVDLDGDTVTYQLECSINGGGYTQIYNGNTPSYAHLVPFGTSTVSYRVKATDPSGDSSAYTTSAILNVVNNNAPVISGSDTNLGVKSAGFTGTYTITDANNNTVTVTEAIDGVRIRSLVATLGQAITYGVTENTWLALPNGSHTLTISATDGIDTTVRTIVFTKLVDTLKIQNATPWDSSTRPSRIMLVITRNIPSAATFKVEVCNNGYDASPKWEDATDAVRSGLVHVFSNTSKTSTKWGVLVRVTVARNGATGACYISAIGGNFE